MDSRVAACSRVSPGWGGVGPGSESRTRWPSVASLPGTVHGQSGQGQHWPGAAAFKREACPPGDREQR